MSDRDWEAELRKIDRRLEHVSDEAVFPAKGAKSPAAKLDALESQRTTSTFGVFARLTLAVLLGAWGETSGVHDLDADGVVSSSDLAALLAAWG